MEHVLHLVVKPVQVRSSRRVHNAFKLLSPPHQDSQLAALQLYETLSILEGTFNTNDSSAVHPFPIFKGEVVNV
jgi:hypothetical protein